MKKIILAMMAATAALGMSAQTVYFDFGGSGSRGTLTTNPDSRGNHWNNIAPETEGATSIAAKTTFADLVDSNGNNTGASLTLCNAWGVNGNSGGGGLASPDASLHGDLAVATATNDYFFTETGESNRTMTFSGLDPKKGYRFYIFGTRNNTECRVGLYHIEGINDSYGAQQVAGNAFASAASQNTANILESAPIFPTVDGTITLTVINNAKTYVALSAMKIEELSGLDRPDIKSYESATLSGANLIEGEATALMAIDRANWQVWAKLNAGVATINVVDEFGNTKQITVNVPQTGIYRVDANLDEETANLFECTYFCVEGSTVGGWNTTGLEMTYQGNGIWNYKGELKGYDRTSDSGRVNFIMNKSWNYTYKRVANSPEKLVMSDGEDIPLNPGNYDITVDLNNMTWKIANGLDYLDNHRITVMGSSVSNGQGATNNEGYAHMYNLQLADRYATEQSSHPFYISNIAINGNSSVNLMNRYDDLEREYGKYVIYAISLGNEGIHGAANQKAIYDQFLTNMQTLITKARQDGKTPIVMNNYTRADFVDSDYKYIKDMNAEIAAWDVPSINMLGAIDDGAGHWASGYDISTDIYHPNTDGHREFFYAMVPSMFDALESGHELTMTREDVPEPYTFPAKHTLEFAPEGTTHSFTLALTASMNKNGVLATINEASGKVITLSRSGNDYVLSIDAKEVAKVSAPAARAASLDNIVITHNYAAKQLGLIVNGTESQKVTAELAPTYVTIGDQAETANDARTVGEVMFYRSSMFTHNPLASNTLNKSSLEIYTPLNENVTGYMRNLAMSTNSIVVKDDGVTSAPAIGSE